MKKNENADYNSTIHQNIFTGARLYEHNRGRQTRSLSLSLWYAFGDRQYYDKQAD